MSDPYMGEIRLVAFGFAPINWQLCDGSLLAINDFEALYSIIGVTYGGDGRNNFAVPNFAGRWVIGAGQGTGLTNRTIGQTGGAAAVTLTSAQMPAHTHQFSYVKAAAATVASPAGLYLGESGAPPTTGHTITYPNAYSDQPVNAALSGASVTPSNAGNGPHNNLSPYIPMNYIICTTGLYPPFA